MIKQRLRLAVLAFPVLMVSTDVHAGPLTITLDTSPLSGTQTLLFGLTNFDASSNTVSCPTLLLTAVARWPHRQTVRWAEPSAASGVVGI